ncbi:hypothetical protein GPZ80_19890 [Actinokineospora sp. HBU206404]|uniref:Uncharacterized protein n=1 Tax=Actinokineospora xionganensis TaxID=2684470 RepID=A0ABR7L9R3_9PSEU|nr:hypothetical protein [Actinokineospora xionganensis]MBC6449428.1 hypothetical protein [Actinokineospora xionganensis]
MFLIPTLAFLFMAMAQWTGLDPNPDTEAALGGVFLALMTGPVAVFCGVQLRHVNADLRALRHPPAAPGQVTPAQWSHTQESLRRLADAETALDDLLNLLAARDLPSGTVPTARAAATDAATTIRLVIDELALVERALPYAMDDPRMASALERLTERIEKGLAGYGALIAAAGQLLAETSTPTGPDQLIEATDHLKALAYALRELA